MSSGTPKTRWYTQHKVLQTSWTRFVWHILASKTSFSNGGHLLIDGHVWFIHVCRMRSKWPSFLKSVCLFLHCDSIAVNDSEVVPLFEEPVTKHAVCNDWHPSGSLPVHPNPLHFDAPYHNVHNWHNHQITALYKEVG